MTGRRVRSEFPKVQRRRATGQSNREWVYEGLAWREPLGPSVEGLSHLS